MMRIPSPNPSRQPKASALTWIALLAFPASIPTAAHCQEPGVEVPGVEVLTRGPVHEAFAGIDDLTVVAVPHPDH